MRYGGHSSRNGIHRQLRNIVRSSGRRGQRRGTMVGEGGGGSSSPEELCSMYYEYYYERPLTPPPGIRGR